MKFIHIGDEVLVIDRDSLFWALVLEKITVERYDGTRESYRLAVFADDTDHGYTIGSYADDDILPDGEWKYSTTFRNWRDLMGVEERFEQIRKREMPKPESEVAG